MNPDLSVGRLVGQLRLRSALLREDFALRQGALWPYRSPQQTSDIAAHPVLARKALLRFLSGS